MHFSPPRKWFLHRQSQLAWADDIIVGFHEIAGHGYELNIIDGNELTEEDQLEIAAQVIQAIKLGTLH